ncbi:MAG TPA: hypothetical protein VFV50_01440, partial [Bdellovibrionales bacterium]|nr:hypothetical protein [Bdellovibrionales bacterium]
MGRTISNFAFLAAIAAFTLLAVTADAQQVPLRERVERTLRWTSEKVTDLTVTPAVQKAMAATIWATVLYPACASDKAEHAVSQLNGTIARGRATLFNHESVGLIYWISVSGTPAQKQRLNELFHDGAIGLRSGYDRRPLLADLARRAEKFIAHETKQIIGMRVGTDFTPADPAPVAGNFHNATELDQLRKSLPASNNMSMFSATLLGFHARGARGTRPFESARQLVAQAAFDEAFMNEPEVREARDKDCNGANGKKELVEDLLGASTIIGQSTRNA